METNSIFVIDRSNGAILMSWASSHIRVFRSGSMGSTDICPPPRAQMTELIQRTANNRLGAVYSALYDFWSSRHHALAAGRQAIGARRDAYSIILFDDAITHVLINDFTRTPDQLLAAVLRHETGGGTDFTVALRAGQNVMEQNWSTERFVTFYLAIVQLIHITSATQSASDDLPI